MSAGRTYFRGGESCCSLMTLMYFFCSCSRSASLNLVQVSFRTGALAMYCSLRSWGLSFASISGLCLMLMVTKPLTKFSS